MLKKKLCAAVAASVLALFAAGCGGKAQVGYFNAARVSAESPQLAAIVKEGNDKLAALHEKVVALDGERDSIGEDEYHKRMGEYQSEAAGLDREYTEKLKAKIDAIIAEISNAKKLDAVLRNDKNGLPVIQGGIDITDEMIKKLQ